MTRWSPKASGNWIGAGANLSGSCVAGKASKQRQPMSRDVGGMLVGRREGVGGGRDHNWTRLVAHEEVPWVHVELAFKQQGTCGERVPMKVRYGGDGLGFETLQAHLA